MGYYGKGMQLGDALIVGVNERNGDSRLLRELKRVTNDRIVVRKQEIIVRREEARPF